MAPRMERHTNDSRARLVHPARVDNRSSASIPFDLVTVARRGRRIRIYERSHR
jgi:hypothetical protein